MSSNDNITEILSRFSRSASQLADLIGRSSSDNRELKNHDDDRK